jgi:long-chain acyl-CoA synthetase
MTKATSARPWLVTYGDSIPAEIDANAYTSVVDMLKQAMHRYSDRIAFRSFSNAITFADTDRLSRDFAAFLQQELGVRKGDRIAVMVPNLLAFPIAMLGIIRAGAAQVNVNPLYTPRELEHQLNDSGAETIVIFNGSTPTLAEVIGKTGIKRVITVEVGDGGSTQLPSPPIDARLTSAYSFADVLARGASLAFKPVELNGEDVLFLQYTGGTTGLSKGATLLHRNLIANSEQFKAHMTGLFRPGEEVIVTALPLYHVFALMVNFITFFSIGTTNWLVANPRDMDSFVEIFKQARPSVFMGVNTLYAGLVAPAIQGARFLEPEAVRRRWRRRDRGHVGAVERDHRHFHSRGLWPFGNRTCADVQPGVHQRVQRLDRPTGAVNRHQAARR